MCSNFFCLAKNRNYQLNAVDCSVKWQCLSNEISIAKDPRALYMTCYSVKPFEISGLLFLFKFNVSSFDKIFECLLILFAVNERPHIDGLREGKRWENDFAFMKIEFFSVQMKWQSHTPHVPKLTTNSANVNNAKSCLFDEFQACCDLDIMLRYCVFRFCSLGNVRMVHILLCLFVCDLDKQKLLAEIPAIRIIILVYALTWCAWE